jgi:uncharacterized LabA/DUF88 family protein
MSGDSDYVDLVTHLKGEGVRVEIAAVKKTTSKFLIEEADYFHEITKEDWFVYKAPRPKKKRHSRHDNSSNGQSNTEEDQVAE